MTLKYHIPKALFLLLFSCLIINFSYADETNLIANGSFEQLVNGTAKGWTILGGTTGSPAIYPLIKGRERITQVDSPRGSPKIAGISQWVKLEPNQNYRLSMQAMMTEGKLTFAVGSTGLNIRMFSETREELPMSPWFWDESWLNTVPFAPGRWREVSFDFNSKEVKQVQVSLGGYFVAGSYSFDDVKLVKVGK